MTNGLFKGTENNKILKNLLAVFRGILAVAILFATLAVDIMVVAKHDELGIPHIPITALIIGIFLSLFSFILGIGFLYLVYYINKEDEKIKKNKALSVFLSAIFLVLGIFFTASSIALGISLYLKSSVEIILLAVNLLSLFVIGRLLDDNKKLTADQIN
jgi:hypothetical protein